MRVESRQLLDPVLSSVLRSGCDAVPMNALRRAALGRAALAATAGVVLLSALVWHRSGASLRERTLIAAAVHLHPFGAETWLLLWQPASFVIGTIALAAIAVRSRRYQLAVAGALGSIAAVVTSEWILKPLVDRRRPDRNFGTYHVHVGSLMFPSAHVTAAAAWATFAWLVVGPGRRSVSRLLVAVPLFTAWCVVATRMHYPTDAAGGLFVGPMVVLATVLAVDQLVERSRRSRVGPTGCAPHHESSYGRPHAATRFQS